MLSGEYAVLLGAEALAFTLDTFLDVYVSVSDDECFHISSQFWNRELVFKNFEDEVLKPYQGPLLKALQRAQEIYKNPPLMINIPYSFDKTAGVGSSSAVILASCLASSLYVSEFSKEECCELSWKIQRSLQGQASGYDVFTQAYGGLVSYRMNECHKIKSVEIDEANFRDYIHIYAGGKGSSTQTLLQDCLAYIEKEKIHESLLKVSEELTQCLKYFLQKGRDFDSVLKSVDNHSNLLSAFPHAPRDLCECLKNLDGYGETWTFKTTGAGGEDSLLFLGRESDLKEAKKYMQDRGWYPLLANFSTQGLTVEEFK